MLALLSASTRVLALTALQRVLLSKMDRTGACSGQATAKQRKEKEKGVLEKAEDLSACRRVSFANERAPWKQIKGNVVARRAHVTAPALA